MNGILVIGGKPKGKDKGDAKPMDDDEKEPDGDEDEEKSTGEEARMEAAKSVIRAVKMSDEKAMDKALKAWCTAAGYGDMGDDEE